MTEFTEKVIQLIKSVPEGKVCTYGGIAALAGSPRGARQVARILHSMSKKEGLPWHRIINTKGYIVIKDRDGFLRQKQRLEQEGVTVSDTGAVDLQYYLWSGPAAS